MRADEVYDWLISSPASPASDAFDRHVVAAIVSLAMAEAADGGRRPLDGIGLGKAALLDLAARLFPAAVGRFDREIPDTPVECDTEEESLRTILGMYCSSGDALERALIAMIARRCKAPHHLWQDLGLRDRGELSRLMRTHFAPLAEKNRQDMKWKKFLYRMVCGSEGFTLCTAPVCSECDDFKVCFGAEDGESRLAWTRNPEQAKTLAAPPSATAMSAAPL